MVYLDESLDIGPTCSVSFSVLLITWRMKLQLQLLLLYDPNRQFQAILVNPIFPVNPSKQKYSQTQLSLTLS